MVTSFRNRVLMNFACFVLIMVVPGVAQAQKTWKVEHHPINSAPDPDYEYEIRLYRVYMDGVDQFPFYTQDYDYLGPFEPYPGYTMYAWEVDITLITPNEVIGVYCKVYNRYLGGTWTNVADFWATLQP